MRRLLILVAASVLALGALPSPVSADLFVASQGTSQVLRYNGTTGAFIDAFVTAASGGLDEPAFLVFPSSAPIPTLSEWGDDRHGGAPRQPGGVGPAPPPPRRVGAPPSPPPFLCPLRLARLAFTALDSSMIPRLIATAERLVARVMGLLALLLYWGRLALTWGVGGQAGRLSAQSAGTPRAPAAAAPSTSGAAGARTSEMLGELAVVSVGRLPSFAAA